MNLDLEAEKWLKRAAISSGTKIEQCEIFVSIFSDSYKKDPLCALQLGIALMLGKPIGLLAFEGVEVPETLKRIADAVESFPEGDELALQEASKRLLEKLGVDK